MSNDLITVNTFCELSKTSLKFKREVTKSEWSKVFSGLKTIEGCVQFWIGDCLKYREQKWGMYDDVSEESGIDKQTLRDIKYVSDSIKPSFRNDNLSFTHHVAVAPLKPEQQEKYLSKAVKEKLSVRELREVIREDKHKLLPKAELPKGEFDVIYADPPWEYEHCATNSRKIENQYPTMTLDAIKEMKIPSAKNSVLFLWATAPKVEEAIGVLNSWGFVYRTCAVWDKEVIGMGYWFRNQHEILLVGCKGNYSPPEQSDRVSSVYKEKRGEHSKKPEHYYSLIESFFPNGKYLELFARKKHNDKWNVYGNQL
jgi:N6-adenosine-specific RNA methylase IME4